MRSQTGSQTIRLPQAMNQIAKDFPLSRQDLSNRREGEMTGPTPEMDARALEEDGLHRAVLAGDDRA